MNRFNLIDNRLSYFAEKLNAKLTMDRPEYPGVLRTFEERRIDWIENGINKAIIIQPDFGTMDFNSARWYFINIAWHYNAGSMKREHWKDILLEKSEFIVIETNIEILLHRSVESLKKIKMQDLK